MDVSLVWGLKANDAMPLLGKAAVAWHFQVPTNHYHPGYPWKDGSCGGSRFFLLPRFLFAVLSCAKCGGELKHDTLEGFLLKDDWSPTVCFCVILKGEVLLMERNPACNHLG